MPSTQESVDFNAFVNLPASLPDNDQQQEISTNSTTPLPTAFNQLESPSIVSYRTSTPSSPISASPMFIATMPPPVDEETIEEDEGLPSLPAEGEVTGAKILVEVPDSEAASEFSSPVKSSAAVEEMMTDEVDGVVIERCDGEKEEVEDQIVTGDARPSVLPVSGDGDERTTHEVLRGARPVVDIPVVRMGSGDSNNQRSVSVADSVESMETGESKPRHNLETMSQDPSSVEATFDAQICNANSLLHSARDSSSVDPDSTTTFNGPVSAFVASERQPTELDISCSMKTNTEQPKSPNESFRKMNSEDPDINDSERASFLTTMSSSSTMVSKIANSAPTEHVAPLGNAVTAESLIVEDEVNLVPVNQINVAPLDTSSNQLEEPSQLINEIIDNTASSHTAHSDHNPPTHTPPKDQASTSNIHLPRVTRRRSSKGTEVPSAPSKKGRNSSSSSRRAQSEHGMEENVSKEDDTIMENPEPNTISTQKVETGGLGDRPQPDHLPLIGGTKPSSRGRKTSNSSEAQSTAKYPAETTELAIFNTLHSNEDSEMSESLNMLEAKNFEEALPSSKQNATKVSKGRKSSSTSKKRLANDDTDSKVTTGLTTTVNDSCGQDLSIESEASHRPGSSVAAPKEGQQSKDLIMAELKAMKMSSIQARISALEAEIANKRVKIEEVTKDLCHPAAETVKRHIKLLHDYNDIRDVGQGLIGMIADNRGVRVGELYEEFGVGLKD